MCAEGTQDQGYAWVVLAAACLSHATFGFMLHGYSVLYAELVEYFNTTWTAVAWIGSVHLSSFGFCGVLLGVIVAKIGCRYSCMLGGLLTALGFVFSSFLVNVPFMCVTYGFLAGGASGLPLLATVTVVQIYFKERLPMANGIRTAFVNIGGLCAGPTVRYLIDTYGLRGSLMLIGGIVLQSSVCGMFLREIKTKDHKQTESPLRSLVHKDIFANKRLIIYYAGILLQAIGITMFYQHIVNYALFVGISKAQASLLPLVLNIGIAVGAMICAFVVNLESYNRILHMAMMNVLKGSVVVSLLFVTLYPAIMTLVGISGVLGGAIFAVEVTNLGEFVPLEKFVTAQALLQTMFGLSTIIGIPLAGLIADLTSSYTVMLMLSGGLQATSAVFYITINFLLKSKTYPVQTNEGNVTTESSDHNTDVQNKDKTEDRKKDSKDSLNNSHVTEIQLSTIVPDDCIKNGVHISSAATSESSLNKIEDGINMSV